MSWQDWVAYYQRIAKLKTSQKVALATDRLFLRGATIEATPASLRSFVEHYTGATLTASQGEVLAVYSAAERCPREWEAAKARTAMRVVSFNLSTSVVSALNTLFIDLQQFSQVDPDAVNVSNDAFEAMRRDRQYQIYFPFFQMIVARTVGNFPKNDFIKFNEAISYRMIEGLKDSVTGEPLGAIFLFDRDRFGRAVPVTHRWTTGTRTVETVNASFGDYGGRLGRHTYVVKRGPTGWYVERQPGIVIDTHSWEAASEVQLALVSPASDTERTLDRRVGFQMPRKPGDKMWQIERAMRAIIHGLLISHPGQGWEDVDASAIFLPAQSDEQVHNLAQEILRLATEHWHWEEATSRLEFQQLLGMICELVASFDQRDEVQGVSIAQRDGAPRDAPARKGPKKGGGKRKRVRRPATIVARDLRPGVSASVDVFAADEASSTAARDEASSADVAADEFDDTGDAYANDDAIDDADENAAAAAYLPEAELEGSAASRARLVAELVDEALGTLPDRGQIAPRKVRAAMDRVVQTWLANATPSQISAISVTRTGSHLSVHGSGTNATFVNPHARKASEGVPVKIARENVRALAEVLVPGNSGGDEDARAADDKREPQSRKKSRKTR